MKNLHWTNIIQRPKISAPSIVDPSEKLHKITDQNLYQLCKAYGERARLWRQKFAGLLPEVFRRKLYEKKGFGSIFEFAKKLAGTSEEQVRRVLNLEKRFENLPTLQSLLVNGQVSANKLVRISSIATNENEKFLAEQVQILSKKAVETLVGDEKYYSKNNNQKIVNNHCQPGDDKNQDGLLEPKLEVKSVPGHTFSQSNSSVSNEKESNKIYQKHTNLNLSPEVYQKLLDLQQKGIDINNLLLEFLQNREKEIENKKQQIAEQILNKEKKKSEKINNYILKNPLIKARPHIPITVKRILREEYGTKCALKSCQKTAENIHHALPFSLSNSHDPKFLVPLCKEHHELAHSIDINYHKMKYR